MVINKKKFLLLVCLLSLASGILSQNIQLKLTTLETAKNSYLKTLQYTQIHTDTISIRIELKKIQQQLKLNGFFLSTLDSTLFDKTKFTAFFSLKEKIDTVALHRQKTAIILKTGNSKDTLLKIPIHKLEATLKQISAGYENAGNAFSKIKLRNFQMKGKTLFADIQFTPAKKRRINKLIFKGYQDFPQSFIKNYFQTQNNSVFNRKQLQQISKLSQHLTFAKEIKPPETLFTADSTFVYVYLKKNKGSSFDGLLNFASQENGKIQLNGYLDLKLNNLLNKGEHFSLLWNQFGNEKQELIISTKTPYIFNSKISTALDFSIYKQDSTFLNTKFHTNLQYQIKNNTSLYIGLTTENSQQLTNNTVANITAFTSTFISVGYAYQMPNNNILNNTSFSINLKPSFGKRKNNSGASNQIKLETNLSYLFKLNQRNRFYFKNSIGILNSDDYFENELFRIGGNRSIRGFKEQSLYAKEYFIQRIEYRYQTADDAYLYSITDLALATTSNQTEKLIGLGIGYLFSTTNAQINISTAIGNSNKTPMNIKNTQFFVNWVNFF